MMAVLNRAPARRFGPDLGDRLTLVLLAWAGAVVVSLVVASQTRVGPTVVTLASDHGVHLGDVVAAAVCFLVATVVTAETFWPSGTTDSW